MKFGKDDTEDFGGEEPRGEDTPRHPTWAEQQAALRNEQTSAALGSAMSEPAMSEPAVSEPAMSEPAVSESAMSEPAVSESAMSETTSSESAMFGSPTAGVEASGLSHDPVEVFELVESGPKKSPKLKKMLAGGAAIAVLGVGSIVAVNQFQSADGTAGGAETPEAVVQEFFDSLSNEDFLGAAETMEPTERRTMVNPGIEMVSELQRLGIISEGMDLGSVPGMDMQFDDMSYVPQSIGGAGDVVRVKVNGTVSASGDVAQLPFGSLITDNLPADELAQITTAGEEAMQTSVESIDDLGVVAVQRDGGWYVSLWYSVAEGIRRDSGVEGLPAFGEGPTPTGGESPEDAVWALANAAKNMSAAEMIGALDPQEAAALYDYSNLFLADAQAELDAEFADASLEFTRIDMRSETDGDDGQVWVDGFAVEVSDNGNIIKVDTAAECMVENVSEGFCELASSEIEEVGLSVDVLSSSAMRVRRVDDRWYISPMASIMQPMLDEVRSLERAQLQGWIDNPDSLFEDGGPIGGLGILPLTILGRTGTSSFAEVGSPVGEWDEDGEWVDYGDDEEWEDWEEFEEWEEPVVPTTVSEFFEDESTDNEIPGSTTSVPAFTFDSPLPGTDTTVPSVPTTTTTAAPQTTVPSTQTTIPAADTTVLIFRVVEAAPAGTSAFSILAEPVEVSPEEAAQYPGALTEAQAGTIEGWVSVTPVEPGDVLRYEWFVDE